MFKWPSMCFPSGYNSEINEIHEWYLKVFVFRTTGSFSTKHNHNNIILVCSKEDNSIRHWWHSLDSSSIFRTTRPVSTKLGTKHPWVKEFKFALMKWHVLFQGKIVSKYQKWRHLEIFSRNWVNFNQTRHIA